jgi:3-methyladenine DNA glycosylase AlkD
MTAKLSPVSAARRIQADLRQLAHPATARQAKNFFKEKVRLLGVTAPMMRQVARSIYAQAKSTWRYADAVALCRIVLPRKLLEEIAVALIVLGRFVKEIPRELLADVHQWIDRGWLASWGEIDCLCGEVLGPLLIRYPDLAADTRKWTASPNRWLRRAAAVGLVKAARRGQLLDAAYDTARRLMSDPEDLVQKATGWLLREAGRTDRKRLEQFLLWHGPKIARTTLRYAIEHFPPAEYKRLLETTKPRRTP